MKKSKSLLTESDIYRLKISLVALSKLSKIKIHSWPEPQREDSSASTAALEAVIGTNVQTLDQNLCFDVPPSES